MLRNAHWEIQCYPVAGREEKREQLAHVYESTRRTFSLASQNIRTGVGSKILICSLPGKHLSLRLYAEGSIDAIIY